MKQYKAVIFDFDGTLANTYEGIFNSYSYAAEQMGLQKPTRKMVDGAIGAAPPDVFQEKFMLTKEDADKATVIYRSRYAKYGIYEVQLYDGMQQLLEYLKNKKIKIGIATLKLEKFAKSICEYLNINELFDDISGVDNKDKLTKSQIILKSLSNMGVSPEDAVLIGDSKYDAVGAKEAGVDFLAVTYGFGFKQNEDIKDYDTVGIVDSTYSLNKLL